MSGSGVGETLFWGDGLSSGMGRETPRTMEFELCSLHVESSNRQNLYHYLCSVIYVLGDDSPEPCNGGVGRDINSLNIM